MRNRIVIVLFFVLSLAVAFSVTAYAEELESLSEKLGYLSGTLTNFEREQFKHEKPARCVVIGTQLAIVRISDGNSSSTGFFISQDGLIVTNAHVAKEKGRGLKFQAPWMKHEVTAAAEVIGIDWNLDLALLKADLATLKVNEKAPKKVPFLDISKSVKAGDLVFCIGCPGRFDGDGNIRKRERENIEGNTEAFLMRTFHYSQGQIIAVQHNAGSEWPRGSVEYDAWTYYGHSGSPICNYAGRVVAVHNSWNSDTKNRHAIPLEKLRKFVLDNKRPPPDAQQSAPSPPRGS